MVAHARVVDGQVVAVVPKPEQIPDEGTWLPIEGDLEPEPASGRRYLGSGYTVEADRVRIEHRYGDPPGGDLDDDAAAARRILGALASRLDRATWHGLSEQERAEVTRRALILLVRLTRHVLDAPADPPSDG